MKLKLLLGLLIIFCGTGPGLEAGEIYQWIDKDGVQQFTDGPPPPGAQAVEGLSETQAVEPPALTGATDDANTGAAASDDTDLTGEGTSAIEGDDNGPTDREDYWRRRGWGSGQTPIGGTGSVEGDQNNPPDVEDAGAGEG